MRRFSFLLLLPLVCLSQDIMESAMFGICSVRINESDGPQYGLTDILCERTSVSLLDEATCVNLTNNVYQALLATDRNLQLAQTNIEDAISYLHAVDDYLFDALSTISALEREHAISSSDADDLRFPINGAKDTLQNGTFDSLYALQSNVDQAQSDISSAKTSLARVTCMSCSPSGSSGSGECPCSDILNEISDTLNDVYGTCEDVFTQVNLIRGFTSNLVLQVDTLVDVSSNILNRLNIPDDRMWGDIRELYTNMVGFASRIDTFSIDLPELFYDIRDQIRGVGPGNDGRPLHLTSEGVIQLNSLAFQIGDYLMTQKTTKEGLFAVTNLIVSYFREFNRTMQSTTMTSAQTPLSAQKLPFILDAFTNVSMNARNRFIRLGSNSYGSATNWFQRVELYLMGLNGFFEDPPEMGEVVAGQDRSTESAIDDLINNRVTNDFYNVGIAETNVVRNFSRFLGGLNFVVVDDAFSPYVPTLVQLLPEIDTDFIDIPEIVIDFTEYGQLFSFTRRVCTLIWYLLIYGFYAGVVYVIVRVAFILVLYIINLSRDL